MRAKLTSPLLVLGAAAVVLLVVLGIAWFGVLAPQRAHAQALDTQTASARVSLAAAERDARAVKARRARVVALRTIDRAMPMTVDMSSVIDRVSGLVARANLRLDSITPSAPVPMQGYTMTPVEVGVTGRYFEVEQLLASLRRMVTVRGHTIHASGPLYGVDSVSISQGDQPLPQIAATIAMDVYAYDPSATPATGAPTPSSTTTAGGTE